MNQQKVLNALTTRPQTVGELARKCSLTKRQVYKVLNRLSGCGIQRGSIPANRFGDKSAWRLS